MSLDLFRYDTSSMGKYEGNYVRNFLGMAGEFSGGIVEFLE
jgi:hypothetical protein